MLNTFRPRRDGRHFPDDIFKCIFLNENVWISIKISLKFVPKGPINSIPSLVQIMAWRRPGDKPLSEPMMVSLLTHICVTRHAVRYCRPDTLSVNMNSSDLASSWTEYLTWCCHPASDSTLQCVWTICYWSTAISYTNKRTVRHISCKKNIFLSKSLHTCVADCTICGFSLSVIKMRVNLITLTTAVIIILHVMIPCIRCTTPTFLHLLSYIDQKSQSVFRHSSTAWWTTAHRCM